MRRTLVSSVVCLLLAGAATGCSSDGGGGGEAAPAPSTVTTTVTAAPSLSREETARQCSLAVAEAAPGWEDWNVDLAGWEDDPRTPEVCKGLADEENPPRGNREFQRAWIDGLEMADDPRADQ
jgi:hypothetical protein